MGGFISAELAIQSPERVERLVLAAAAGISVTNLRSRPTKTFARVTAALGALTATRSRDIITRRRLRHIILSTIVRHPSRLEPDLLYEIMRGSGKSGYVDALEALVAYDFRDSLGQIRCPTLIVWGRQDMLVPVRDAAEFERLIPETRQIVMEDTGHVPMLERPDAFNRCLLDFLSENEPTQ
jgi:pimeloyl-ACP methyl ester carboxylesterase